jgi:hypothetical protein
MSVVRPHSCIVPELRRTVSIIGTTGAIEYGFALVLGSQVLGGLTLSPTASSYRRFQRLVPSHSKVDVEQDVYGVRGFREFGVPRFREDT